MRDLEQFRLINQFELNIIDSSISKLNPKLHDFLIQNFNKIYVSLADLSSKVNYPSIFLISDELQSSINHLKYNRDLIAAGLYLGFLRKSEFYLSLEGADYFYHNGLIPKNRLIIINNKGEKSTLYGNNITKEMVIQFPENIQIGDVYLIINELNEFLAISIAKVDSTTLPILKPKDVIAQNLVDKGIYLREKQ
ncbi:MAG: hypothetical protein ACFE9R_01725 [Candidatus Hermodarchaeota archaeon]